MDITAAFEAVIGGSNPSGRKRNEEMGLDTISTFSRWLRLIEENMEKFEKPKIEVEDQQQSFEAILEEGVNERRGDMPLIHVMIRFSPHATAEDAKGLNEAIAKCDIFMPEMHGWTLQTHKLFTDVSNGSLTPEEAVSRSKEEQVFHGFILAQFQALYETKKKIGFIDLSSGYLSFVNAREFDIPGLSKILDKGKTLEEIIESARAVLQNKISLNKKREDLIRDTLYYELDSIVRAYPELKEKKELNVLLQLGNVHTRIYHELKKDADLTVQRFHKNWPQMYDHGSEALRRGTFGLGLDDELVCRTLIEAIFRPLVYYFLKGENIDTNEVIVFLRKWVSVLPFEKIKSILMLSEDKQRQEAILSALSDEEGFAGELNTLMQPAREKIERLLDTDKEE